MENCHAPETEKLQLKIGGMQCSFCVSSIQKALTQIDGVQDADVNLAHEEVLVLYDREKVAPSQLRDTLAPTYFGNHTATLFRG